MNVLSGVKRPTENLRSHYSPHCLVFSVLIILSLLLAPPAPAVNSSQLPELGDAASGTVSRDVEYRLGRAWLRSLRSQTAMIHDPLITNYLEYLVYRLAEHSQLEDRRLELITVKSPVLNAFAVPGGIVGVNGGLFLHAHTEQEFSSVLAHELAHLSQRHFARGVEASRRNQVPGMVALLASIVIAATAGADAGLAAMTASQAAILDTQLRHSRAHEQEADRIGLLTMVDAGMDPEAMANMFERMFASQRLLGSRPPEFLLTHPVTESRIADARSRAAQLSNSGYKNKSAADSLEFQLMRTRIELVFEETMTQAIKRYRADIDHPDPLKAETATYGLALAHARAGNPSKANQILDQLLEKDPNRITYWVTYAEINQRPDLVQQVEQALREQLTLNPGNHPLSLYLAKTLTLKRQYGQAVQVLEKLSRERPNDPNIWYELAETYGLSSNILGVHQARAEYFILTGRMDRALEQLDYSYQKAGKSNYYLRAKIDQRRKDVYKFKEELKQF